MREWFAKRYRRFMAWRRWDLDLVCSESERFDAYTDYHDYPDSTLPEPLHMFEHTCRRCGKKFFI